MWEDSTRLGVIISSLFQPVSQPLHASPQPQAIQTGPLSTINISTGIAKQFAPINHIISEGDEMFSNNTSWDIRERFNLNWEPGPKTAQGGLKNFFKFCL